MERLLDKINNLEAWQVACIIAGLGLIVFITGLHNPFQGDDAYQIVNNVPVHSIKHIPQFFNASTFYNGEKLTGVYYRPLMSTVFSIIYTFFGPRPIAFHLVQLALYISSAFVLYLVFKHFLKPGLALALVLIFLVHPLNSQIVYSIPTMQDALFFFFGILALWLLICKKSAASLWAVAACLFLAMLSKEAGFVFTIMAFLYLFWFDRERLRAFAGTMILPIVLYLALKLHAVGINHEQHAAPIDSLNLVSRLWAAPSIELFYLTKFLFPWKLATGYYWVYPAFSFRHVLLPLVIDLAIIGLFIYGGIRVRQKLPKPKLHTYFFFAAWTSVGLVIYLPMLKLDMTACETWFYFTMAGLLGMIGVVLLTVKVRIQPEWLILPVILLIGILGIRSALRGTDYHSEYTLAVHDLAASGSGNYAALGKISQYFIDHGKYKEAAKYAQQSINIYPIVSNYTNLGVALEQSGNYPGAVKAYNQALKYGDLSVIYENLGLIFLVYSDPAATDQFFQKATNAYPHDFKLWVYYAIFEGAEGHTANAKLDLQTAAKYGDVPPVIYDNVMNDRPLVLPLLGKTLLVR